MAAPALATIGSQLATNAVTIQPPVPAGVTAGDVILVHIYIEAVVTITGPTGFAEFTGSPVAASSHRHHILWKRATGADSGTYDFAMSISPNYFGAYAERYTGCIATGNPTDGGLVTATSGSTSVTTTPAVSLTTTDVDRLLVWFATNFSGGTWGNPTGFTGVDTGTSELHGATKAQAVAGATGSLTGSNAASSQSTATLLALLPEFVDVGPGYNPPTSLPTDIPVDPASVAQPLIALGIVQDFS